MKENTGTIIAMLEELLTISKSRQASQSGSTNAANMDIAPFKTLIEEAGQRTEAGLAKFAGKHYGLPECNQQPDRRDCPKGTAGFRENQRTVRAGHPKDGRGKHSAQY